MISVYLLSMTGKFGKDSKEAPGRVLLEWNQTLGSLFVSGGSMPHIQIYDARTEKRLNKLYIGAGVLLTTMFATRSNEELLCSVGRYLHRVFIV